MNNSSLGTSSNSPPELQLDDWDNFKHLFLSHAYSKGYDTIIDDTILPVTLLHLPRNATAHQTFEITQANEKKLHVRDQLSRLAFGDVMKSVQKYPDIVKLMHAVPIGNAQ